MEKKREINSFFFPVGRISAARGGNGNDRNVDADERKWIFVFFLFFFYFIRFDFRPEIVINNISICIFIYFFVGKVTTERPPAKEPKKAKKINKFVLQNKQVKLS